MSEYIVWQCYCISGKTKSHLQLSEVTQHLKKYVSGMVVYVCQQNVVLTNIMWWGGVKQKEQNVVFTLLTVNGNRQWKVLVCYYNRCLNVSCYLVNPQIDKYIFLKHLSLQILTSHMCRPPGKKVLFVRIKLLHKCHT